MCPYALNVYLLNIFPVLSSAECARAFEMFGDLTDASHLWSDVMEGGLHQRYVDVIDSSINSPGSHKFDNYLGFFLPLLRSIFFVSRSIFFATCSNNRLCFFFFALDLQNVKTALPHELRMLYVA